MKHSSFLDLSQSFVWVTVIASILIVCVLCYLVFRFMHETDFNARLIDGVVLGILVLTLVVSVCLKPKSIDVDEQNMKINLTCGHLVIEKDEISKIEHYSKGIESTRVCGCGMFFGDLGYFSCQECGRYLSFVTNPDDICIIYRKDKLPVAISITDPSVLNEIATMKEF